MRKIRSNMPDLNLWLVLWMACFLVHTNVQPSGRQTFYPIHSKKEPHKSSMSCHQLFPLIGIQFSSGKKSLQCNAPRITGPWPKKSNIASIHCAPTLSQILDRLFRCDTNCQWVSAWGSHYLTFSKFTSKAFASLFFSCPGFWMILGIKWAG